MYDFILIWQSISVCIYLFLSGGMDDGHAEQLDCIS